MAGNRWILLKGESRISDWRFEIGDLKNKVKSVCGSGAGEAEE